MKNICIKLIFSVLPIFLLASSTVHAEQAGGVKIVALGASGTFGKWVRREEAFPAQLERLLRADGINATVVNAGTSGNSTSAMLGLLDSSVSEDTKIVILQPGSNDSNKLGSDTEMNVERMLEKLKKRNIQVILFAFPGGDGHLLAEKYDAVFYGSFHQDIPDDALMMDNSHHPLPAGHLIIAQKLFTMVERLLGKGSPTGSENEKYLQ